MEIHNERKLKNIIITNSADTEYKDFMKICKKCTSEPFSFLTIDTTVPVDYLLKFRKSLVDSF